MGSKKTAGSLQIRPVEQGGFTSQKDVELKKLCSGWASRTKVTVGCTVTALFLP
jgi:hypothetical protein